MASAPAESFETLRGRKGAHTMHARNDSKKITKAARAAFLSRFEREVDPEGKLSPRERARRAEHARRAYFADLALKSVKARRKKARARKKAMV
jgi:hypothetical protein